MAIYHILVYLFFAVVMSIIALMSIKFDYNRKSAGIRVPAKKNKKYVIRHNPLDIYLWAFVLFFTIISAIRWGVGTDSISYATGLMTGENRDNGIELGYAFLKSLVHNWGLHFSVGLGVLAFLQIYFITKSSQDYKYILVWLPIVMFGSCYYLDLMNGIRQMIVACAFVWATKFIVEKRALPYFLFVLFAFTMHKSALILAVFYFIPSKISIADKRILLLVMLTVCFVAGLSPQFQGAIRYVEGIASFLGYDNYVNRVSQFMDGDYTSEAHSLGPMQLSYLLIAYFVVWFGPKLKKKYEKRIPEFNMWYFFSVVYACLFFLVCNISHIFIRPVQYFEVFQLFIVALLLHMLYVESKRFFSFRALLYVLLCIIWTSTTWNIVKTCYRRASDAPDYVTYKVFFMHQDEVRECELFNE